MAPFGSAQCSHYANDMVSPKGQLISKWFFGSSISSKKWTNESNFTTMIPQVDLLSFVFWGKSTNQKNHFEIKWPLPQTHGWWNHLGYLRYVPKIFWQFLMFLLPYFGILGLRDFLLIKWILCFVSLETICSKQIFSASTTTIGTSLVLVELRLTLVIRFTKCL